MFGKQKSTGKVKKAIDLKLEALTKRLSRSGKKGEKTAKQDKSAAVESEDVKVKKKLLEDKPTNSGSSNMLEKQRSLSPAEKSAIKSGGSKHTDMKVSRPSSAKSLTDDEKLRRKSSSSEDTSSMPTGKATSQHVKTRLSDKNKSKETNKLTSSATGSAGKDTIGKKSKPMDVSYMKPKNSESATRSETETTKDEEQIADLDQNVWDACSSEDQQKESSGDDTPTKWVEDAFMLLESCKMTAAEKLFSKTVSEMRELPEKDTETFVQALDGLTQVYSRKAKKARYNPLEAQWWSVISLTLLKEGMIECKTASENSGEDKYENLRTRTSEKFKNLDGELLSRLYLDAMLEEQQRLNEITAKLEVLEETGLKPLAEQPKPPEMKFLQEFQKYCIEKLHFQIDETAEISEEEDGHETEEKPWLVTESLDAPKCPTSPHEKGKKRLSFSESDNSVPRQRDSIIFDEPGDCILDEKKSSTSLRRAFSFQDSIKRSLSFRKRSSQSANDNRRRYKSLTDGSEVTEDLIPDCRKSIHSVKLEDQEPETSRTPNLLAVDNKAYYRTSSVSSSTIDEEVEVERPGGQKASDVKKLDTGRTDSPSSDVFLESQPEVEKVLNPPVSEKAVNITLAYAVSRLADLLYEKKELTLALVLYIRSFNMFRAIETNTVTEKHIGEMLRNMAKIKSEQNDPVEAIGFMERALLKFRGCYGDDDEDVMSTLYQLGDLYMKTQWKGENIMDHMIAAIHKQVNKDYLEEDQFEFEEIASLTKSNLEQTRSLAGSVDDLDESDDEDASTGEKLSIWEKEAFSYYEKVVKLIQDDKLENKDNIRERSIIKMADCCFMDKDYETSLTYYEESLVMLCKESSAMIAEHAHVLNMIAVANFSLQHYGKAASMFDMAHVLNQSLLGTSMASLEIACAYSLWAITCWMLKWYNKCVLPGIQAYDICTRFFETHEALIPIKRKWVIGQTLYILGSAFNKLRIFDKAMDYFNICLANAKNSEHPNTCWIVRIFIAMGENLELQKDYERGLDIYYHGLEILSHVEERTPGFQLLRNQLLNKVIEIHFTREHYDLFMENMEMLVDQYTYESANYYKEIAECYGRMAEVYVIWKQIDKAIKSYSAAVTTYEDYHKSLSSEIAPAVAKLAFLYQVKSGHEATEEKKDELIKLAEENFKKSVMFDMSCYSSVLYANFLHSCCRHIDAISVLNGIEYLTGKGPTHLEVTELLGCALPNCLQRELAVHDKLRVSIFSLQKYLAAVGYTLNGEYDWALIYVNQLKHECSKSSAKPIDLSLLGYAQMVTGDYKAATVTFSKLCLLQEESELSLKNMWSCVHLNMELSCLVVCECFVKSFEVEEEMINTEEVSENNNELKKHGITDADHSFTVNTETELVKNATDIQSEEWRVIDEYSENIKSDVKDDSVDEWRILEEHTEEDIVQMPDRIASTTEMVNYGHQSSEEEWKTIDDTETVAIVPMQDVSSSSNQDGHQSEEEWRVLDDHTETVILPVIQDGGRTNGDDNWRILDEHAETNVVCSVEDARQNNNKSWRIIDEHTEDHVLSSSSVDVNEQRRASEEFVDTRSQNYSGDCNPASDRELSKSTTESWHSLSEYPADSKDNDDQWQVIEEYSVDHSNSVPRDIYSNVKVDITTRSQSEPRNFSNIDSSISNKNFNEHLQQFRQGSYNGSNHNYSSSFSRFNKDISNRNQINGNSHFNSGDEDIEEIEEIEEEWVVLEEFVTEETLPGSSV